MPSEWITHVKNYASKNNINYSTALKDPKCSQSYKMKVGSGLKGSVRNKETDILNYSDPDRVWNNAIKYLKKNIVIALSTKKNKKYMVRRPDGIWVHFGEMGYEDFTKHKDKKRQSAYLKRTENIKGNWKSDKYSANNLARNILWADYKVGSGGSQSIPENEYSVFGDPIPTTVKVGMPYTSFYIDTIGTQNINMLVNSMNEIRQRVKYFLEVETDDLNEKNQITNEIYYLNRQFKNNYDELQTLVPYELQNWINLLSDDRINILATELIKKEIDEEPDVVDDALAETQRNVERDVAALERRGRRN